MFDKRILLCLAIVGAMLTGVQPTLASASGELKTYPAGESVTATGEQTATKHRLTLTDHPVGGSFWTFECNVVKATGVGSSKAGDTAITVHPTYEGCTAAGLAITITTTNCDYVYRLGEPTAGGWHVTTDISCTAGSSIKIASSTCELTIGTQTGVATSEVTNAGSASPETAMDLLVHTNLSGLKYTVTKDGIGCSLSGTGSFSKGDYTGTTTIKAHDSVTKAAVNLTIKPPPPPLLIATGEQVGENVLQLTDHLIGAEPAMVKCTTVTLVGTEAVETVKTELRVHPEYKGCTAFGAAATVTTTGCDYLFHIGAATAGGWHATTDVVCSTESVIKVVSGNCEVTIKPQTGLTTSELTNAGTEAEMDLVLHTSIGGIRYIVVKDGTGCPLGGTGEFTKGDYSGTTTIRAHDASTLQPIGITKS